MERCFKSLSVVALSRILIRKNATLKHFVSARLSDVSQTKMLSLQSLWYNVVQRYMISMSFSETSE